MSIPKLLALDVEYEIDEKDLEKTMDLKLEINKEKFNLLNQEKLKNGEKPIDIKDVEKIVVQGSVQYIDNEFKYIMNPNSDDTNSVKEIEQLLEIKIDFFKKKHTYILNHAPYLNVLLKNKNYEKIVDLYYKKIIENNYLTELGQDLYDSLNNSNHKYQFVYKTLLNTSLNQLKKDILPQLEDLSCQETESLKYFKYNMYIPDNYLWEIPIGMKDEEIKVEKMKYTLRYLTDEELFKRPNQNVDENYINNLGKEIFSFENISDDLKMNHNIVKMYTSPKLLKSNNDIILSGQKIEKYLGLKCYFSIDNKFFTEKLDVNWEVEL